MGIFGFDQLGDAVARSDPFFNLHYGTRGANLLRADSEQWRGQGSKELGRNEREGEEQGREPGREGASQGKRERKTEKENKRKIDFGNGGVGEEVCMQVNSYDVEYAAINYVDIMSIARYNEFLHDFYGINMLVTTLKTLKYCQVSSTLDSTLLPSALRECSAARVPCPIILPTL